MLRAGGVVPVPEVSFEPSRGVIIIIQQNICDGRCPSDNPKDMPAFTYHFSPPPSKLHSYTHPKMDHPVCKQLSLAVIQYMLANFSCLVCHHCQKNEKNLISETIKTVGNSVF